MAIAGFMVREQAVKSEDMVKAPAIMAALLASGVPFDHAVPLQVVEDWLVITTFPVDGDLQPTLFVTLKV
ncbi:hypothetical protein D3C85_1701660 [compost metagenome]